MQIQSTQQALQLDLRARVPVVSVNVLATQLDGIFWELIQKFVSNRRLFHPALPSRDAIPSTIEELRRQRFVSFGAAMREVHATLLQTLRTSKNLKTFTKSFEHFIDDVVQVRSEVVPPDGERPQYQPGAKKFLEVLQYYAPFGIVCTAPPVALQPALKELDPWLIGLFIDKKMRIASLLDVVSEQPYYQEVVVRLGFGIDRLSSVTLFTHSIEEAEKALHTGIQHVVLVSSLSSDAEKLLAQLTRVRGDIQFSGSSGVRRLDIVSSLEQIELASSQAEPLRLIS